jgi:hypothetical protein
MAMGWQYALLPVVALSLLLCYAAYLRWIEPRRDNAGWARRKRARTRADLIFPSEKYKFIVRIAPLFLLPILSQLAGVRLPPFIILGVLNLGVIILAAGIHYYAIVRRKRFSQDLEDQRHLVCPDCHYILAGSLEQKRCPECGYTFTPDSLARDWADVNALSTFTSEYDWRD